MARKKATTVEEVEEVDDIEEVEELDEVDDIEEVDSIEEGMTAKALAKALGTDGRTVRKFLRSKFGKVGQGKRWNINPDDVEALQAEFAAFGKRTTTTKKKAAPPVDEEVEEIEELENDELDDISDIEDLSDLEFDEFDDELDD